MNQIEEEALICYLDAATEVYQANLTSEQRFKGTAMTLEDLQVAIDQHWRQSSRKAEENWWQSPLEIGTISNNLKMRLSSTTIASSSSIELRRTRITTLLICSNNVAGSAFADSIQQLSQLYSTNPVLPH